MIELYGHPFSSYTWKALIPLYESETPFTFRMLDPGHPENGASFGAVWPVGKFPLLVDDGRAIMESTIIAEYVAPDLIPADRDVAIETRMLDRIFDNHVMGNMQRFVNDALKPPERRDAVDLQQAGVALDNVYVWLDDRLSGREWAAGGDFTLADCAAAPSLFYADWVRPIPDAMATLQSYRTKVLARPSVARAVDEARPYRHLFPLGAPDRD